MNENIKAGADIHGGDGGYSIGTKKKYDEFVKGRNQSLGQMRIRELAKQAQILADEFQEQWKAGPSNEEFFQQKFAELIVRECVKLCEHDSNDDEYDQYDMGQSVKAENIKTSIKQHFGVEE